MESRRRAVTRADSRPEPAAPRIRAAFFDAGNTLVWVDHVLIAAVAGGLSPEAVREGDRRMRPLVNERLRDLSTESRHFFAMYFSGMLREAGFPEGEIPAALERIRKVEAVFSVWRRANPEARPCIEALKRAGVKVAVISNADGRVASLLEACGLADPFEFILDSHLEGVEKPDPRFFLLGCEKLGVSPGESLYVGDIPEIDVKGARAAGLTPVLYDPLDAFPGFDACRRVRDLREIKA